MAQVFLGQELMRVDNKGRLGVPARFMSVLREMSRERAETVSVGTMITPERSIKLVPITQFIEEVEHWSGLDDRNESERMVRNLTTGSAELVTLDKQNRVKLNQLMMEVCDIRQQVVIVGCIDYMQVFDVTVWKEMFKKNLGSLGKAMEKVSEKDRPAPQPTIKQYIINTAEIEARREQVEENDASES
jgi:division/cell wall cluster transcriptional repressor MraZ